MTDTEHNRAVLEIKSVFCERDLEDHLQFLEIAECVVQSPFLVKSNIPEVVKDIAEFALGAIRHCAGCGTPMHLLLSEVEYITHICVMHNIKPVHCAHCFHVALRDRMAKYELWLSAVAENTHPPPFRFVHEYPYTVSQVQHCNDDLHTA